MNSASVVAQRDCGPRCAKPLVILASLLVADGVGCRGSADVDDGQAEPTVTTARSDLAGVVGLDPAAFGEGALTVPLETVACTLSSGEASSCYQLQLSTAPADHKAGPFCPRTTKDGPETAGTWIHEGKVLDADGAFIVGLAQLYGDPKWKLYDEATGRVRYTATKDACAAAARPDVDEAYQNHCVECSIADVDASRRELMLIPVRPVPRREPGRLDRRGSVGVALNGVRLEAPAPLDAILSAYTIAAFDDCGGHVNLNAGYHYHGAKGCSKSVVQDDAHAPLIGYAVDGYAIHAMNNVDGREPSDLDVCRGHSDANRGYHYHAASPGENMFIGCLHGQTAMNDAVVPRGAGPSPADAPSAGAVLACAEARSTRCCGDGTCDGPETRVNCAVDCAG